MAIIQSGTTPVPNLQFIESNSSGRSTIINRGNCYGLSATTGLISAGLGANSALFMMRVNPSSTVNVFIKRVRLQFTCLVGFTTPLTAGRRLELFRSLNAWSGTAPFNGALVAPIKKKASLPNSQVEVAVIATTAALSATSGMTFEATPFRTMSLAHVGNAGNFLDFVMDFNEFEGMPIQLEAGQTLAIRNPTAMDALGQFSLSVAVDWEEATGV